MWHIPSNAKGPIWLEIVDGPANPQAIVPENSRSNSGGFIVTDEPVAPIVTTTILSLPPKTSSPTITALTLTTTTLTPDTYSTSIKTGTNTSTPTGYQQGPTPVPVPIRLVIGITVGGVAMASIVIFFVYCLSRRRRSVRKNYTGL